MRDDVKSMKKLVDEFCMLNRTATSPDHNKLVEHIGALLNTKPLKFQCGTDILTWEIPRFWTVKEAYLSNSKGEKIIDFKNNPLHLWANSIKFIGKISFEELEKHLLYNKEAPSKIPHHNRNQYVYNALDWGFCLSYNDYLTLTDNEYYVHIDTTYDYNGTLDIINYNVQGETDNTVLFSAHTCHPGIATDGLTNVAVLIEVIKRLNKRKLKNSYRFVFGPEFYAAAAYLSQAPDEEISNIKGTYYLDMLGNNEKICWQTSFFGNTYIDKVTKNVMNYMVKDTKQYEYRKLWGNDETFYNGQPYVIPSCGIGGDKFNDYHFNTDNESFVNYDQLAFSIDLIEKMIDIYEKDYAPTFSFKGPLYLSKYDLYWDAKIYPDIYTKTESIQILTDGKRSVLEIADLVELDFDFVYEYYKKIEKRVNKMNDKMYEFNGAKVIDSKKDGYAHLLNIPTPEELDKFYSEIYFDSVKSLEELNEYEKPIKLSDEEILATEKHQELYDNFNRINPIKNIKNPRMLSVGCGGSVINKFFELKGFETLYIEPSKQAIEFLDLYDLKGFDSTFEDFDFDSIGKFDLIDLSFVLEHVPNPKELIKNIEKCLTDDGILYLQIPNDFSPSHLTYLEKLNGQAKWISNPDHINYFNFESINNLLNECGLVEKYRSTTFPLDLLLIQGFDFYADSSLVPKINDIIKTFESSFKDKDLLKKYYESIANLGLGRNIVIYAGKQNL